MQLTEREFLLAVKGYIERMEVKGDYEWGDCRNLKQIIKDGDMPEIYSEVLLRLRKERNGI